MKTWFITGASTGLGRCIAEEAFRRGDRVAAVAIDPQNMEDYVPRFGERAFVKFLDVTNAQMVADVFAEAVKRFGTIDVCVNNAGFMHLGAVEELTEAEVRKIMDTNFMGNFFVAQQAARHMREKRSGTIIQMASLAGVSVLAGNAAYGASKWAVEGMSEALRHEMEPFGVKVLIVEPGTIKTGIAKRSRHSEPIAAYAEILAEDTNRWVNGDDSGDTGDPEKCAKVLSRMVDMDELPMRLPLTALAYDVSVAVARGRIEEAEKWAPFSRMADISYSGEI